MAEYIDREAVITMLETECSPRVMAYLVDQLNAIPAADVRPVVRGKWKEDWETGCSECSACGESYLWEDYDGVCEWNFCPNCGADMRPTLMSGANGEGKNENRAD